MEITFNFQKSVTLVNRKKLKLFIITIFKSENKIPGNLSIVFCSDNYLLKINKSFLNHDYFTDIVTFNLTPKGKKEIDAEIYISINRVKENAKNFKSSNLKELHRVIFHGILHLCGYDDKKKLSKLKMTQMEDFYLNKYFPRETS